MKKKQKDKSRYLFYVIAVGVLILFLLMVISSLLNIGEKLRRISEYLEYGFYALVVLLFYFVSKIAIGEYQKNVFGLTGGELRNGGVNVNFKFDLFDKNVWDVWFRMIIGMLDTENIITTGIFLMGIVVFFLSIKFGWIIVLERFIKYLTFFN